MQWTPCHILSPRTPCFASRGKVKYTIAPCCTRGAHVGEVATPGTCGKQIKFPILRTDAVLLVLLFDRSEGGHVTGAIFGHKP